MWECVLGLKDLSDLWDFSGFNVVNGRMVRARTGRYWECGNGACPHRALFFECGNVLVLWC